MAKRSRGRRSVALGMTGLMGLGGLAGGLAGGLPLEAFAGPQGGQVTQGAASIARQGAATVITQDTPRAALSWESFDIGRGERVQFRQPSTSSIALNTIRNQKPTQIQGQLTANGQVWIQNPQGVVFGRDAKVNVGGLLATTAKISESDFAAAEGRFRGEAGAGAVSNAGLIEAGEGGVVLVAPMVENTGTIQTQGGDVAMAAATGFSVDFEGDGLLQVVIDPAKAEALALINEGTVRAEGGTVQLTAAQAEGVRDSLVSVGGIVEATGMAEINGEIVITGGALTELAGTLSAPGGEVAVNGDQIAVRPAARVDVSAPAGGGRIEIGHRAETSRVALPEASPLPPRRIEVARGAEFAADATASGDAGSIEFWSSEATAFAGHVSARALGPGDGGFVDISSAGALGFSGTADLSALEGARGLLLFDPLDITVGSPEAPADANEELDGDGEVAAGDRPGEMLTIEPAAIEAVMADVSLAATGLIDIAEALTLDGMTLTAVADEITVNAGITLANDGGVDFDGGTEGVSINGGGSITGSGDVMIIGSASNIDGTIDLTAGDITIDTTSVNSSAAIDTDGGFVSITGSMGGISLGAAVGASGNVTVTSTSGDIFVLGPVTGDAITFDGDDMASDITVASTVDADGLLTITEGVVVQITDDLTAGGGIAIDGTLVQVSRFLSDEGGGVVSLDGGTLTATSGDITIDAFSSAQLVGDIDAEAGDLTVTANDIFVEAGATVQGDDVSLLADDEFIQVTGVDGDLTLLGMTIIANGTDADDQILIEGDTIGIHGSLSSSGDIVLRGPGDTSATAITIGEFTGDLPIVTAVFEGEGTDEYTISQSSAVGPGTITAATDGSTFTAAGTDIVVASAPFNIDDMATFTGGDSVIITAPGMGPGAFLIGGELAITTSEMSGTVLVNGLASDGNEIDVGALDIDADIITLVGEIDVINDTDIDAGESVLFGTTEFTSGQIFVDAPAIEFDPELASTGTNITTTVVDGDATFTSDDIDGNDPDDDISFTTAGDLTFQTLDGDATTSIDLQALAMGTLDFSVDGQLTVDADIGSIDALVPTSATIGVTFTYVTGDPLSIGEDGGDVSSVLLEAASLSLGSVIETGATINFSGDVDLPDVSASFSADTITVEGPNLNFDDLSLFATGDIDIELLSSTITNDLLIDTTGDLDFVPASITVGRDLIIQVADLDIFPFENLVEINVTRDFTITSSSLDVAGPTDVLMSQSAEALDINVGRDLTIMADGGPVSLNVDFSEDGGTPGIEGVLNIEGGAIFITDSTDSGPIAVGGTATPGADGIIIDGDDVGIFADIALTSGNIDIDGDTEVTLGASVGTEPVTGVVGVISISGTGDQQIDGGFVEIFADVIAEGGDVEITTTGDLFIESVAEVRGEAVTLDVGADIAQATVIGGTGEVEGETIISDSGDISITAENIEIFGDLDAAGSITLTSDALVPGMITVGGQPAGEVPLQSEVTQDDPTAPGTIIAGDDFTLTGGAIVIESDLDIMDVVDVNSSNSESVLVAASSVDVGSFDIDATGGDVTITADGFTTGTDVNSSAGGTTVFEAVEGSAVSIGNDLILTGLGPITVTTNEGHTVGGGISAEVTAGGFVGLADVTFDGGSLLTATDGIFAATADADATVLVQTDITALGSTVTLSGDNVTVDGVTVTGAGVTISADDAVLVDLGSLIASSDFFNIFAADATVTVNGDVDASGDVDIDGTDVTLASDEFTAASLDLDAVGGTADVDALDFTVVDIASIFGTTAASFTSLAEGSVDIDGILEVRSSDGTATITTEEPHTVAGNIVVAGGTASVLEGGGTLTTDSSFDVFLEIGGADDGQITVTGDLTAAGAIRLSGRNSTGGDVTIDNVTLISDTMNLNADDLLEIINEADLFATKTGPFADGTEFPFFLRGDRYTVDGDVTFTGEALSAALAGDGSIGGGGGDINDAEFQVFAATVPQIEMVTTGNMTVLDLRPTLNDLGFALTDLLLAADGEITISGQIEGTAELVAQSYNLVIGANDPLGFTTTGVTVEDGGRIGVRNGIERPYADLTFIVDGDVIFENTLTDSSTILAAGDTVIDITGDFIMPNTTGIASPLVRGEGGAGAVLGSLTLNDVGTMEIYGTIGGEVEDAAAQEVEAGGGFTFTAIQQVNDCPLSNASCESAPIFDDSMIDTDEDMASDPLNIDALVDDPDGDAVMVESIDGTDIALGGSVPGPEGGTFTLLDDGTLIFDPGEDFQGLMMDEEAVFSVPITVVDTGGDSAAATLTVTVLGINDAPVGMDGALGTDEDMASAPLTAGDLATDPDMDVLTIAAINGATVSGGSEVPLTGGGVLVLAEDGTLTFEPRGAFEGLTTGETVEIPVEVTVLDAFGESVVSTVTVTVAGANDAPIAAPGMLETTADMPSDTISAIALVMDPEMQALMLELVGGEDAEPGTRVELPEGGALIVLQDGVVGFDPSGDFDGLAEGVIRVIEVDLTVVDSGAAAATVPLTITVTGVGGIVEGPVLIPGMIETTEDMASAPLSPTELAGEPGAGALTITAIEGVAPGEDGVPGPGGGTLSLDEAGNLVFDPGDDFQGLMEGGTDTLTVTLTVANAEGLASTTPVTITVGGLNDDPSGMGAMLETTESMVSGGLEPEAIGTDPDMDMLAFTQLGETPIDGPVPVEGGGVVFLDEAGNLVFDPSGDFDDLGAGQTRTVSIPVTVEDPFMGAASGVVEITVTGEGTGSTPGAINTDEDMASAGLPPNDLIVEGGGDPFMFTEIDGMAIGSGVEVEGGLLFLDADGNLVFDPQDGFQSLAEGEDSSFSVDVTLADGSGEVVMTAVTVTILGLNDAPEPVEPDPGGGPGGGSITTPENDPTPTVMPDDIVTDPEMDAVVIVAVDGTPVMNGDTVDIDEGGTLLVDANGNLVFDPGDDFDFLGTGETQEIPVTLTLEDSSGAETTAELLITVIGENDGPSVEGQVVRTDEDTAAPGIEVAEIATDPEMDPIIVLAVAGQEVTPGDVIELEDGGTLTVAPDGTLIFDPGEDFQSLGSTDEGQTQVSVTLTDPEGAVTMGDLVFLISGENDAPEGGTGTLGTDEDSPAPFDAGPAVMDPDASDTFTITSIDGQPVMPGETVALAGGGSLTVGTDGALIFDPEGGFQSLGTAETDTLTVALGVTDSGGETGEVSLEIQVLGVNDAPLALDDQTGGATFAPFVLPVLSNDTDPEGDGLMISEINGEILGAGDFLPLGPTSGIEVSASGTSLVFVPGMDFDELEFGESTTVQFSYAVSDGGGGFSSAFVTVEVSNSLPPEETGTISRLPKTTAGPTAVEDGGPLGTDTEVLFGYFSGIGFLAPDLEEEDPVTNRANDEDWPRAEPYAGPDEEEEETSGSAE